MDLDAWVLGIRSSQNTHGHWSRVDALLHDPAGAPVLLELYRRLLIASRDPATGWSAASVMDRIEAGVGLLAFDSCGSLLLPLLYASQERPRRSHFTEIVAQGHEWAEVRRRLEQDDAWHRGPSAASAVLDLVAAYALRGIDVSSDAVVADARALVGSALDESSVAWIDPAGFARLVVTGAAEYHARGSSRAFGTPPGPQTRTAGAWRTKDPIPGETLPAFADLLSKSHCEVEAVHCARDTAGHDTWPETCRGFAPFGAVPCVATSPASGVAALGAIAAPAVHGGAYSSGLGPIRGLHAAWRTMRILLDLPPGTPCGAVIAAVDAARWAIYPTTSSWFAQISGDGWLAFMRADDAVSGIVAWTDSD